MFQLFIQECTEILREKLKDGFDVRRASVLNGLFNEAVSRREQYNQSSQLVLEALYYRAV